MARKRGFSYRGSNPLVRQLAAYTRVHEIDIKKLAVKAGYSPQTIYSWSTYNKIPTLTTFVDVCEAAGLVVRLIPTRIDHG